MKNDWFEREKIPDDVVEYLLTVKVEFKDGTTNQIRSFQRNTRDDLQFDYELLEEELQQTPAMIAFYNSLFAEQKAKVAAIQRRIANSRGMITDRILKDYGDKGIKIRREDLKDIIEGDQEIMSIHQSLISETAKLDKLRAVADALSSKNDNLRSLAGFKRDEKRS